MAEHVGYMMSYDEQIVPRLRGLLKQKKIPQELEFIAGEMVLFIGQE